jgi:predicted O-linked N-acetylglucosamine transferase (SPINDLY family)
LRALGRLDQAVAHYRDATRLKPDYAEAHHNLAEALFAMRNLSAAAESYRRAIALNPDFAAAHNGLGNVLKEEGTPAAAEISYRRALAANPGFAEAYHNLAGALLAQGRAEEAIESYRAATRLSPNRVEPHQQLGDALQVQGRFEEAAASYRRAVELMPDLAEGHNNLGDALFLQNRFDEAIASFRRALALMPGLAEAHYNLGNALLAKLQVDEAIASYREAIRLRPDLAPAQHNLGRALASQNRVEEALACYERARALRPDLAEAHNNIGNLLKETGRLDEAVASYNRALTLTPDDAVIHNNLGAVLHALGRSEEAIASYRRALAFDPDYVEALCNLGDVLNWQGKRIEALAYFARAVALKPDDDMALASWFYEKQHLCDWDGYHDAEARARKGGNPPYSLCTGFTLLGISSTAQERFERIRRMASQYDVPEADLCPRRPPRRRERIRLGYLSADFRQHAVAVLCAGLIEQHDRREFEVIGYSYGPDDHSGLRGRFARAFDRFHDIAGLAHRRAAELIHADEVDILVDLTGYTGPCRPMILAHRPAPIQVNYLGYPSTMGADFVDYVIVDRFVVPADQQPYFSEKLVHLPACYQCNDDKREIAAHSPSRAECRLPEDGFVFCCFNNVYKITPDFFEIWMRLLRAVPGSVLWLMNVNHLTRANLAREATARGVEPARIVLAPPMPLAAHLGRHRLADLFLDTLPYNAHTTGSDALWAGLPVVTCAGDSFAGRVGGSLLRAAGLPELVTSSLEEYEKLALRLARDPALLRGLRDRLAQHRTSCPLFDTARSARDLEAAYRAMQRRREAGLPPAPFAVAPFEADAATR